MVRVATLDEDAALGIGRGVGSGRVVAGGEAGEELGELAVVGVREVAREERAAALGCPAALPEGEDALALEGLDVLGGP
ncbi:MAG: hypothetical protein QOF65_2531 [Thermoleophilaceae bacterium]|nr:hypothetical protein [Thermoleophilaceae bacterium]